MPRLKIGLILVPLFFLVGCRAFDPPENSAMALRRVNDNLSQIDRPLYYTVWVSCCFRDADGKMHHVPVQDGRLAYNQPQSLLFNMVHSLEGTVAQFGSNNDHYWLWVEPETRTLWVGSWDCLGQRYTRQLAIPPHELLDALMLRPLPELMSGDPPRLEKRGWHYWLVYDRRAPDGTLLGQREVKLDRFEPYQPLAIIDKLADGQVWMHARTERHRTVGKEGPCTPRHYVIDWPIDDAELRIDVLKARFRPDLPEEVFDSPTTWNGHIEILDGPLCGELWDQFSEGATSP